MKINELPQKKPFVIGLIVVILGSVIFLLVNTGIVSPGGKAPTPPTDATSKEVLQKLGAGAETSESGSPKRKKNNLGGDEP